MINRETFFNPPSQYRPIPFWFWNSSLKKDEIIRQIQDFHKKGLGGFFVHARFGLETEYLSREWMDCIKTAVETAEKLDMEVWLYDENGFPSGIGNLKVSRIREYRARFIDLTEISVSSGEKVCIELPVGEVLLAQVLRTDKHNSEPIDISDKVIDNKIIWNVPAGSWKVSVYSNCILEDPNDVIYGVNYLNTEAMRYFFDYTLDSYEKFLSQYFGKTIKGIFTDEPTLLPWHHGQTWYLERTNGRVITWDGQIETLMIQRENKTAKEFLPHIFNDIDNSTPQIRASFWNCVIELYKKSFFEPYKKWCDNNGLIFTGHLLFEEGLYVNTAFQSDMSECLKYMHIPGTDHLGNGTEFGIIGMNNVPNQITNIQGGKLTSSVAHLNGSPAALSESFGCGGWDLTLQQMKTIVDWQYSLGITMLCPHAMFYSIEGFRKTDAPPSENHMPAWKNYNVFADYVGRLSYMLRSGHHSAKVALFYPVKDFQVSYRPGIEGETDRVKSDSFDLCAKLLTQLHFDYDIVSEGFLKDSIIENGFIKIKDEQFSMLIAPPSIIKSSAANKLKEFLESGGVWITAPFTLKELTQNEMENCLTKAINELNAGSTEKSSINLESTSDLLIKTYGNGKIAIFKSGTQDADFLNCSLDLALNKLSIPDIKISSIDNSPMPGVRYVHRVLGDIHLFFITNTYESAVECKILIDLAGFCEEWNPENGQISPIENMEALGNNIQITKGFASFESTFFVVYANQKPQSNVKTAHKRDLVYEFHDEWQFKTDDLNSLHLDNWNLKMKTDSMGSHYIYKTSFDCEYVPSRLLIMLDDIEYRSSLMGNMDITVDVNGHKYKNPVWGWHIDNGFKTLDIAKAAVFGKNDIEITILHTAWCGQPLILNSAPVILGDFACLKEKAVLMAPVEAAYSGSWTEYGYPFYSGTASYTQSFKAPRVRRNERLILSIESVKDSVEIYINNKLADIRLWQPWEADITDIVTGSRNLLTLKVTNSMANFLESKANTSGLIGKVRLFIEKII